MLEHEGEPLHEILDVGEVEAIRSVALDAERVARERVLDEELADTPADAARAVERRRADDRVRQVEYLVVGADDLLPRDLERAVDADRVERVLFVDGRREEVAVHHARREKDKMLDPAVGTRVV